MINEIFFLSLPFPPELIEGSSRVSVEKTVEASSNRICNKSYIMTSSLRGQPLQQEPSESPRKAPEGPEGKGGFRGSPSSVKKTSIIQIVM